MAVAAHRAPFLPSHPMHPRPEQRSGIGPVSGAPHTADTLTGDWARPYGRRTAVFPTGKTDAKYWPPVARINEAYGDRNLVCNCPPPEAFAS